MVPGLASSPEGETKIVPEAISCGVNSKVDNKMLIRNLFIVGFSLFWVANLSNR